MARDISAVGSKVAFKGGLLEGLIISEFPDDATPFDCPDIDVSTNSKNLNGEMISSRTPSVIPFSVSVLAGSAADVRLSKALSRAQITPGSADHTSTVEWYTCTVSIPEVVSTGNLTDDDSGKIENKKVTFSNCRIKTGPTGPSTSTEGRLAGRTYGFEAEIYTF